MSYDDPNRESVGLDPIWTGADETEPPPEPKAEAEAEVEPKPKAGKKSSVKDDAEDD